ncbi:hypothetical protein FI667_g9226, partial [Globisporangium splendens]
MKSFFAAIATVASTISAVSGLTYVDPAAAQYFQSATGNVIEIIQEVNGTTGAVWDDWLQKVWIGSNTIATPGVGRGMVGLGRNIAAYRAVETITAAALPVDDVSKIPTITYTITTFGDFPWTAHTGFVQFIPTEGGKKTTLNWSNKTIPKKNADGTTYDDSALRAYITTAVTAQVKSWAAAYKQ